MDLYPFVLATALGAVLALLVCLPIWQWSLDRVEKRTIEFLNEQFDEIEGDRSE